MRSGKGRKRESRIRHACRYAQQSNPLCSFLGTGGVLEVLAKQRGIDVATEAVNPSMFVAVYHSGNRQEGHRWAIFVSNASQYGIHVGKGVAIGVNAAVESLISGAGH